MSSFPSGLSKFWSLWSSRYLFSHKWQSSYLGGPRTAIDSGSWRGWGSKSAISPFLWGSAWVSCAQNHLGQETLLRCLSYAQESGKVIPIFWGNHLRKEGKISCSSPWGWRIQVYHLWPKTVVDFYKLDQSKKYLSFSILHLHLLLPVSISKSHWIISLEWPHSLIKKHVRHHPNIGHSLC